MWRQILLCREWRCGMRLVRRETDDDDNTHSFTTPQIHTFIYFYLILTLI